MNENICEILEDAINVASEANWKREAAKDALLVISKRATELAEIAVARRDCVLENRLLILRRRAIVRTALL